MKLKYERQAADDRYVCWLVCGDDRMRVATIDKGFWELPRRTRWELSANGQTRRGVDKKTHETPTTYHDTLTDAKEALEWHLAGILKQGLTKQP